VYKETLLRKLPPFKGNFQLITTRQTVGQIIREVLEAHKIFYKDYDLIAGEFYYPDPVKTFKGLFNFLKANVHYNEESEEKQTVASPAGILSIGEGDCKHYASFIGGVLDSLKRQGANLDWNYRFASYDPFSSDPGHVFVVARANGREYWIDPVLKSFDLRLQPSGYTDKKINIQSMPLYRVSGVNDYIQQSEVLENADLDPSLVRAIQILIYYGVMDVRGNINDKKISILHNTLPADLFAVVMNARIQLNNAAVGGLFSTVWRGVKKVSLFLPRNAFLSLVNFNVFAYATKLKAAVWNADGTTTEFKNKLKDLWQNKFGGDWSNLQNTILRGASKGAILGAANGNVYIDGKLGAAPAAVPAWVATASAIIAAVMPLVNAFLKKINSQAGSGFPTMDPNLYPYGICSDGVTPKNPDGTCTIEPQTSGDVMTWIKENPVLAAGIGVGGYYLVTKFL
jgi:hypothetical protein